MRGALVCLGCVVALGFGAFPALAQMLPGADDPDYRAAMGAALAADDPQAMAELHALAEGGNAAATVALATVATWYSVGTTLAERNRFRRVNGQPLDDAAGEVSPAYALWSGFETVQPDEMFARAEGLFEAGEPLKGAAVLNHWVNQTGAFGEVPAAFWTTLPAAPWTRALALVSRLASQPESAAVDLAILATWMDADLPEGWLALNMIESGRIAGGSGAEVTPLRGLIEARLAARDPAEVADRQAAAAALRAQMAGNAPDAVAPAAMDGVTAMLAASGADLPLRLWCNAACPLAPEACRKAAVAAFGVTPSLVPHAAPMTAALPLADWFASPRGSYSVVSAGFMAHRAAPGDPEAISVARRGTAMTRAREMDACFADAVDAALPDLVTRRFAR